MHVCSYEPYLQRRGKLESTESTVGILQLLPRPLAVEQHRYTLMLGRMISKARSDQAAKVTCYAVDSEDVSYFAFEFVYAS